MRKHGVCCGPVSVCLSRSWILSRWLKISSNFFVRPVAPLFSFFTQAPIPNSKGSPFSECDRRTPDDGNTALHTQSCDAATVWHVTCVLQTWHVCPAWYLACVANSRAYWSPSTDDRIIASSVCLSCNIIFLANNRQRLVVAAAYVSDVAGVPNTNSSTEVGFEVFFQNIGWLQSWSDCLEVTEGIDDDQTRNDTEQHRAGLQASQNR